MFVGFLSRKAAERRRQLEDLRSIAATLVFFEAPGRLRASLKSLSESLGGDRRAAICRELTKKFEEVVRGSLEELELQSGSNGAARRNHYRRGKERCCTRVVGRFGNRSFGADEEERSLKDSVSELAATSSVPRNEIYRLALKLKMQSDLAEGSE